MKTEYLKNAKCAISLALAIILAVSLAALLPACSSAELYSEGDGELDVVTTIFAPFDFARVVGGERVKVTVLQDNGADLHNYSATSATLEALTGADVFIYVGGTSDSAWVDDAIEASGNTDLITVCLMDHITPIYAELENDWSDHSHSGEHDHDDDHDHEGEEHDHDHGADEHVWNSLKNAKLIVEAIEKAFVQKDPDGASVYAANAAAYVAELDKLDAEIAEAVANSDVEVLVFADRFPFVYLLHDYHIPYVAAFSGCSTEVNASFDTQVKLIDTVRDNSLKYVFTIEGDNKTLAESVSAETGCKILTLNSMQSVTRSNIKDGATYLEIMKENVKILKEALS